MPSGSPKGYNRGIKNVQFRPTAEQRQDLETEATARGLTVGQEARRRCFPNDESLQVPRIFHVPKRPEKTEVNDMPVSLEAEGKAAVSERGPVQDADPPDRKRWLATIRSVRIATARYSNKNIAASGLTPVRITRYPPRFKLPYKPVPFLDFAPQASMLKLDEVPFKRAFHAQLSALDLDKTGNALVEMVGENRGLILLCFEDLRKPNIYCHRSQVAAWLMNHCGIEIEEYPETL